MARLEETTFNEIGKTCPFCAGDLLPRAQKCKYCGGWVVAVPSTMGPDWQNAEPSPGQRLMLKRFKEKVPKDMTRGEAAARLAELKSSNLSAFAAMAGAGHKQGKTRSPVGVVVVILLLALVAAGAWFHVSGRSEPVLSKIDAGKWLPWVSATQDVGAAAVDLGPAGAEGDSTDDVGGAGVAAGGSATATASLAKEGVPEDPEYVAIAENFRPVRPGREISVSVRGGTTVAGALKAVLSDRVIILRPAGEGHAEISLKRQDLAAWSRATLYESDYVAYVMAKRELRASAEEQAAEIARRAEDYRAAFTAMQQERRQVQLARHRKLEEHRRPKKPEVSDDKAVKSGQMSIREYMLKHNTGSDALKARQERVRQFEAQNPGM